MTPARKYFQRRLPLITFSCVLALALSTVYANSIHRYFFHQEEKTFSWSSDGYAVSLTLPKQAKKLQLKVSVDLNETAHGCEFLYGAAIFQFPLAQSEGNLSVINNPRYLIKFSYDLKNKRCESKDLSIDPSDIPTSVTIQFVDTSIEPGRIIEAPRREGVLLAFTHSDYQRVEAKLVSIEPSEPFRSSTRTPREAKFSANPKQDDVEMLLSPYESLRVRIIQEFQAHIERCKSRHECGDIKIAVSLVTDPDILTLIEAAESVGIHVENVNAAGPRKFGYKTMPWETTLYRAHAPWFWLRGNPDFNRSTDLPMHAKFIIFGDETVISANSNYNLDLFYKSRETALVYHSPEIVRMFQELFALIRTSVFYPLNVDLRDNFILLFNADRPRGYAASSRKPYQSILTNEEVESNAYGILFELIARNSGGLVLDMSPISNYCSYYRRVHCLYDLINERVSADQIRMILNLSFYQPLQLDDPRYWNIKENFWTRDTIAKSLPSFEKNLSPFIQWNTERAGSVQLMSMLYQPMSNFHARSATLGDDLLLNGSANYAHPSTLNTIEILRSPALRKRFDEEISTADEPYFVAESSRRSPAEFTKGRCEFVYERDLLRSTPFRLKNFSARELIEEANKRAPELIGQRLELIQPRFRESAFENQQELFSLAYDELPLDSSIREPIKSYSSYFCLHSTTGGEIIVRASEIN